MRSATGGPRRRARSGRSWGASRSCSAPTAGWDEVRERLSRRVRHRELLARGPRAARRRRDRRRRSSRDLGDRAARVVPRLGAARRQALSAAPRREIEREVGGRIKQARGWRVDLSHPALDGPRRDAHRRRVLLLRQGAGRRRACRPAPAGGWPCLLSGGIDSPVAAWRHDAARLPGAPRPLPQLPDPLARLAGEGARDRRAAHALPAALAAVLVPFGELQQQVVLAVPPPLRVVIYRRLMLRIAERIARRGGRRALVTGEVVGQVASQTLENLTVIAAAATLPSCGRSSAWTRTRSSREAQRLGTYPDLHHPRPGLLPALHAAAPRDAGERPRTSRRPSATCRSRRWCRRAIDAATVEEFRFPVVKYPVGHSRRA